jgi:hypothetical protein
MTSSWRGAGPYPLSRPGRGLRTRSHGGVPERVAHRTPTPLVVTGLHGHARTGSFCPYHTTHTTLESAQTPPDDGGGRIRLVAGAARTVSGDCASSPPASIGPRYGTPRVADDEHNVLDLSVAKLAAHFFGAQQGELIIACG